MTTRVRSKRSSTVVASSIVAEAVEPAAKVSRVYAEGKETKACVHDLVGTLNYGPAPESPAVANAWLDDHGRAFGHFIGNKWIKPEGRSTYDSFNPATREKLATTIQGIYVLRRKRKIVSFVYRNKRRYRASCILCS